MYIYNPTTGEITSTPISGTDAKEPGEMVEANGKLLVSALNKGIYVIDTKTHQLKRLSSSAGGACTLFKMNDEVWAAVNNCTWGTPSASNIEQFVEIDTQSFEAKTPVTVPMACQNSSFAWKKTSPAIDAKNRVLYYAPADCDNFISKYDMNTGEFTQNFITIPQGQKCMAMCATSTPTLATSWLKHLWTTAHKTTISTSTIKMARKWANKST